MVDNILEASIRVLKHHPYQQFTTNRVAEAAGISIGSLYQYFPNKQSILLELEIRAVNEMIENVEKFLLEIESLNPQSIDEFNNIKNSNQKFFWLQTPHTLLDPAGKSHLKGHAGVGWKEKNSNFHFAFQNMEPGKKLSYDYLEWEEKKKQYDLNNIVDRTRAICMNRRAHLITSTNKKYPHDYTKHKANLFIQVLDKDGKWKGNYTYATKELTEIRTKVMKKSQILSYVKNLLILY